MPCFVLRVPNCSRCRRWMHSRTLCQRDVPARIITAPRGEKRMRKFFAAGLVMVTLAMTLVLAHSRARDNATTPADPIFGRWMMDQTKSVNNRRGDHATFPTQHVRILAPEGDSVRNTLANTPTSAPEYSYAATFDGKAHPDPRFPGRDQTL